MARILRHTGSLAFVAGLFTVIFAGLPWAVVTSDDPVIPWWLRTAIFALLGGLLMVLATVAIEQKSGKTGDQGLAEEVPESPVLLMNAAEVPGRPVGEILGLVEGHTVYAIWLGNDLSAIMRLILGGELTEYTQMMGRARKLAAGRMAAEAGKLGADAVINVRYTTTSVVGTASELLAYGTAVKLSE